MATPPDFTVGAVLTAAQMNAVGLWLVTTQTVGTTVSTVTVNNAFNDDFVNYRVVYSGGVLSTAAAIRLSLGTAVNTADHYWGRTRLAFVGGGFTSTISNNDTTFQTGVGTANGANFICDITNPFTNERPTFTSLYLEMATTSSSTYQNIGYLNSTASFSAFFLSLSTGTFTGGTISVYGYN
jgi:hypothetical protein